MTVADGLTTDFLERYLPQRLGCESIEVTELIKFPRGSSRETWFGVLDTVTGTGRQEQKLVFRRNFPGGSVCPMPLRTEYEVYARLQRSAVPVAEVLWYEDDLGALEGQREFYVRRHIEGSWEIPHLCDPDPQYNRMRIDIAKEHIGKLALIHQCDWRALGFGEIFDVPPTKADAARTVIDSIERQLAEFQIEPFPLFHEAREWLFDNEPDPVREIVLLKGTNGYGEEIFVDGKIVAMSDWELACLGDPAYDWAQIQDFAMDIVEDGKPVWGLQPALDYYESLTGIHIPPADVMYYRKLYSLIMVMFCHKAAIPVTEGTDLMARLCWPSTEVLHCGLRMMAEAIGVGSATKPVPGQLG